MSKKQTMKVYHGIPKSITDEHSIFYDSMENMPKGFSQTGAGIPFFKIGVTGAYPNYANCKIFLNEEVSFNKPITVDLWLNDLSPNSQIWIELEDENNNRFGFQKADTSGKIYFTARINSTWKNEVIVSSSIVPSGTFHIRYVANIQNNIGCVYINGKMIGKVSLKNIIDSFNNFTGRFTKLLFNAAALSDLHISDIDRGDYFPNLPQDFIDGKAIIKPRMGQQQIKGDPLYSQYTLLKVEAFTGVEYPIFIDNNYKLHRYKPELSVKGANNWSVVGTSFRIKGLNGEIISGIIDSDTALCRVMKDIYIEGNTCTIEVDNTEKISVNDELLLLDTLKPGDISYGTNIYTVTSKTDNSFTARINNTINKVLINAGKSFVETTASSSSPVVKTEDGTVVTGTWTGLGTNQATFTLGTNTNITGKDLYVEYSLIIPSNNSDFNELPYNIDKAYTENGLEMNPVNTIVITDDFKGKISGSMKECPHYCGYAATNQLSLPGTSFTEDKKSYTYISQLNGNTGSVYYNATSGNIPQHLFVFDLIEIIERKLGCEIPAINKIQWVKENLIKISVEHWGYGEGPKGNKIYMQVLNNGKWSGDISHTASTVTRKPFSWNGRGAIGNIDNGKVSFLVYTDASDGTTPSTVYTDYISIELKLKIDSTFTTLYCENTRAREDKCNPVLIQKETKTVKRYLPSKECFTTECKYTNPKYEKNSQLNNTVYKSDFIYFTTLGSGKYIESNIKEIFANCLNYLGKDATKYIEPHKFINNVFKNVSMYNLRFVKVPATSINSNIIHYTFFHILG